MARKSSRYHLGLIVLLVSMVCVTGLLPAHAGSGEGGQENKGFLAGMVNWWDSIINPKIEKGKKCIPGCTFNDNVGNCVDSAGKLCPSPNSN